MGISGLPDKLVHLEPLQRDQIPLIKRFSGGGTVIVDDSTLFVTFIFAKKDLDITAFPEPILRWSADLYSKCWKIPGFRYIENDFAIGEKKCGGNAQYIQKDRWLHHTSFLWDYESENMNYLHLPEKRPKYRSDRSHEEFLCKLKSHCTSPQDLISKLKAKLAKDFDLIGLAENAIEKKPHRKSTQLIY